MENIHMKIYSQEIADGLHEALEKNSTIAYASPVLAYTPSASETKQAEDFIKSKAENKEQIDLYYLSSVLVSTGWNKNDDVFDPQETWAARNTPEDKQFNFMHDESDIIGHITGNYVVDFDGNPLEEDVKDTPSEFNIITTAVLYTSWGDAKLKERMNEIIEEIKEGDNWFVSMECLFPDFDYALMDSQGATKVIKREEASAFLTKHLRSYGGTGQYEDYTVGRLLRDISFSGKGLVSKPANPRSVILRDTKRFDETESRLVSVSSIKENKMSDILEKQVAELKAELAETRAYNEKMQTEMEDKKAEAIQTQLESFESTVSEKDEAIASLEALIAEANTKVTELEEALSAAEAARDGAVAEVAEIKKAAAFEERVTALVEAGLDESEIEEAMSRLENLDDETFGFVVAQITKAAGKPPWLDKENKDEDDKDDKKKAKKKASLEQSEEEVDDAEADASEEVLESAEADEDVALAEAVDEDDPAEDLRASASEWFGSLLKSTANIQE
jgi:chemotaxis protein histidine kinase CheA